ncbi:hypothetical protein M427DRAFT_141376 [Gonapodya prolifera JEL478]|uniref:Uncharacterized protein n=1 Tax=Gonapodya prolifera (strain JEL478) TaxID=1344416 RepID=A0A138ZX90_GONPJ|nr:hypothetical protein M427DRAFT_141376 [Gonapodya prolifera JEL478]|eukprot:KXS09128.1 hypothetical protein M427DRAFT_141376 [Gonapodya prolifera JEL478]
MFAPSFAICGNPGIGKTYFLFVLLLWRLRSHKPTAFQWSSDGFVYFSQEGVRFYGASSSSTVSFAPGAWALADSNQGVQPPCEAFVQQTAAIVIQATSPKEVRYKEWLKQRKGKVYWMNPWDWPEMWFVGCEMGPVRYDADEVWGVFTTWTPCARTVLRVLEGEESGITDHTKTVKDQIAHLPDILMNIHDKDRLFSAPNDLVVLRADTESRTSPPIVDIISNYVMSLMFEQVERSFYPQKAEFLCLLADTTSQASVRGNLFQLYAHMILTTSSPTNNLIPATPLSHSIFHSLVVPRGLKEVSFTTDDAAIEQLRQHAHEQLYCKPIQAKFPTVDAFIILPDLFEVFLLQMTVASRHSVGISGLQRVEEILMKGLGSAMLSGFKWKLIFVTPTGTKITRAQKITGKEGRGGEIADWDARLQQFQACISMELAERLQR